MDDYTAGKCEYSVSLKKLIEEFKLETLYMPEARKIKISQPEVNRPGLALSGFFEFFDPNRVQLFGNAEHQYIASLSKKERLYRLEQFAVHHPPVIILTNTWSRSTVSRFSAQARQRLRSRRLSSRLSISTSRPASRDTAFSLKYTAKVF